MCPACLLYTSPARLTVRRAGVSKALAHSHRLPDQPHPASQLVNHLPGEARLALHLLLLPLLLQVLLGPGKKLLQPYLPHNDGYF